MRLPERLEKFAHNSKDRLAIVAEGSKRRLLTSRIGQAALGVKQKVYLPKPAKDYLDIPSKSMVPITVANAAMFGGFSLTPEMRPYTISVGIISTLGSIAVGIHLNRQENATQQPLEITGITPPTELILNKPA